MPFDSAVLLPGIYPTDGLAHIQEDAWSRSFIVAEDGKQSVCPSMKTGRINYVHPYSEIVSIIY